MPNRHDGRSVNKLVAIKADSSVDGRTMTGLQALVVSASFDDGSRARRSGRSSMTPLRKRYSEEVVAKSNIISMRAHCSLDASYARRKRQRGCSFIRRPLFFFLRLRNEPRPGRRPCRLAGHRTLAEQLRRDLDYLQAAGDRSRNCRWSCVPSARRHPLQRQAFADPTPAPR